MKTMILPRMILALTMIISPLAAQAGGRHGGRGERFMKQVEELDLSADQKKKLAEIKKSFKEAKPKRDAVRTAHEDLKTALQGTATDEEIKKKFEAMQAIHNEMMKERFSKVMAIRAILTPEQRAKFKGLQGPGMGPPGGGHGHGPEDEPGTEE